jgi:predicted RNase H-like HicB family nuclease
MNDPAADPIYPVYVRPDRCTDGTFCYVAEHPDLPGCAAHGDTIAEAKQLLSAARAVYIRRLRASGRALPVPSKKTDIEWQASVPRSPTPLVNWAIAEVPQGSVATAADARAILTAV